MMNWWLDKGIDGFRIDAISHIKKEGKFNMVFKFEHLKLWNDNVYTKLDLVEFKQVLSKWQNALYNNGWNDLFIENHDIPRSVSTIGNDKK